MSYYAQTEGPYCGCYIAKPLPWCVESILIPQLNNGATYRAEITDHFNTKYIVDGIMVVNSKGHLDTNTLPDGLLTPFAGSYVLKVYNSQDLDTPVHFVFDADTYECILLKFQDVIPTVEEAEIL